MTEISVAQVKALREATNVSMMECRKALEAAGGDPEKAFQILRERGLAIAGKKAGRAANSGLIAADVFEDGRVGAMVEVNCETDFVARNESFGRFVRAMLERAAAEEGPLADKVQADVAAKIAEIGENIIVRRNTRLVAQTPGAVGAYVHLGGKIGVLVEVGAGNPATLARVEFRELLRDLTLHIAACSPLALDRTGIPAEIVAREREIYAKQVTGKPPQIVEKIVGGKLEKFYKQVCLLEQEFVKDPDQTVHARLEQIGKAVGDTLTLRRYVRYQLGSD